MQKHGRIFCDFKENQYFCNRATMFCTLQVIKPKLQAISHLIHNDYPQPSEQRAASPKAHSIGHRPMYMEVGNFAL